MPTIPLTGGLAYYGTHVFQLALTPALVALNTSAEQSFVVTALPIPVGSAIIACFVNKPTAQAGLGIVGVRYIDATHIGVTFANFTAGNLTPTAAEVYTFVVIFA